MSEELVDGSRAPLGTWSARAAAAFSLGLISEREFKECSSLRKIRNLFAHSFSASFDDQAVKACCANLTYSAASYDDIIVDARGQFTTAAVGLILNLINRPHYVARQRPVFGEWKI